MRFRLIPKSMTLDDLERIFCTLFQNICAFGAHHETICTLQQRCSAMTVVLGLCGYSREFRGDEASNDSGVIENVDFQCFRTYVFGTLGNEDNIIIQYYLVPCRLPLTPKYMTLNDTEWPFYVQFSLPGTAI